MADVTQKEIDDFIKKAQSDLGGAQYAFKGTEAPKVQVISTGIPSLDAAIGLGGWPRGCVVEVFGKASVGKTALMLHTFAEVHKQGGYTFLDNIESLVTVETWFNWANATAPPGWDPQRHVTICPPAHDVAITKFSEACKKGFFDVMVFDSIGALSTEKELEAGNNKQAFGQSAMVTQLIKQAMNYCNGRNEKGKWTVPIFLNQVRDDMAGTYVIEKAPGGRAKEHGATLRLNLRSTRLPKNIPDIVIDGEKTPPGFTVGATLVKNKVGAPRKKTSWEYWNYPSPDGVLGIDVFANGVGVFLAEETLRKSGAWYYHDEFPEGKLQGGPAVVEYLRGNPALFEKLRRETVMKVYNKDADAKKLEATVLGNES